MRTALLCAMALVWGSAAQQTPPKPPEHYAAIETWVQGKIVEIDRSAGLVRIVPADAADAFVRSREVMGRVPGTTLLELRYAKGWVYFDDPDGGPQQRFVLREGRKRLEIGQLIEIGGSNDYRGGVQGQRAGIGNSRQAIGGAYMKFEGWILVRVNDFLAEQESPGLE